MILVTGASGLVGTALLQQLLQQGNKVKALYHTTAPVMAHDNLYWQQCDILDIVAVEEVMQAITEVYHCAAVVSFNSQQKKQLLQVNVEGTTNVVNACINAGVRKLIYVSSVAAIGRTALQEPVNESMVWRKEDGSSVYAKTKHLAEMEVWRGIGEGLCAVIVNPSIILGEGDWTKGSTALFKSAYDEFLWYTKGATGFVDVEDVANAMILLMQHDVNGERFILNGANAGYRTLFSKIALAFGKKPPYKKVSPLLAAIVWRAEAVKAMFTGKKPLLTKETALTAQKMITYDNTKLLKLLPHFNYTPLEATIKRVCTALVSRYHLK